ncbi:MAG: UvrD-helicase domain-containing protein [Clostridia bacterium]|nr:UvrD-helicase domain-containing protein [Clostridia bacterium]
MGLTNEQKQAIMHDKGNILVSASAGSGKTFVMIERLIRLIVEGHADVSGILAVTFTNLAAAEMKEKLVNALTAKINDPQTDAETAKRLKEQLSDVPNADISTFHSFCNNLVKNYFYELGLDASVKIADEVQANILKTRAMDSVFEERYASGSDQLASLLKIFVRYRSDEALKKHVLELHKFFESEAYPSEAAKNAVRAYGEEGFEMVKAAFFEYYCGIFNKIKDQMSELKDEFLSIGASKQVDVCNLIYVYSDELINARDFLKMAHAAIGMDVGRLPSLPTNGDVYLEQIKEKLSSAKKRFSAEIKYLTETFAKPSEEQIKGDLMSMRVPAEQLIELCLDFGKEYSRLKREENVVDFPDLEHFTLALLEKDEIRSAVSSRYEYVFADEYQDTNGVQEEILLKISRDNLFMVGDVKQSIYAFRGCNPTIFARKFDRFKSGSGEGTAMSLTSNFRSSSEVLACVNRIFGEVMTEETAAYDYKSSPMRGGNGEVGVAEMHIVTSDDLGGANAEKPAKKGVYSVKDNIDGNADEETFNEGVLISALIKKAACGTVFDKDVGERPMTYGDVVILTRSMGPYTARLAETLADNDIPVTSSTKQQITLYPEIRQLVSFLRLLDSVRQDVALCGVMRGPIGGFTDAELVEIRSFSTEERRAVGERDSRTFADAVELYIANGEGELKEKLTQFYGDVERWRVLADYVGAGEILATVVRERNLDMFYSAAPDGKNRIKRIDKFIQEAGAPDRPYTVREYLDRLDSSAEDVAVTETSGGDAVRIMSIHASKGLEFPVVITCGLNRLFNYMDLREEIIKDRELGIALKTYDTENMKVRTNILCELLKKRFKEACVREEMRILYVALTRAKSALYLTQTRKSDLPNALSALDIVSASSYSKLISAGAVKPILYSQSAIRSMCVPVSAREVVASASDEQLEQKIAQNLSFAYSFDTELPAKSSVTALLNAQEDGEMPVPVLYEREENDEYLAGEKREAAIARGNAYHRVMELADFNKWSVSQIIEQKHTFVEEGLIEENEASLVDEAKICEILKDEFFRMPDARYFRELPFEVLVPARLIKENGGDEEVLVQGVIDLIAFVDGGIHIADYKVSGRGAERLKQKYATQLELYSYAAERITGKRVLTKRLYNLSTGEKIEL